MKIEDCVRVVLCDDGGKERLMESEGSSAFKYLSSKT